MSNEYIPERAMFIYAHPDDIEFGCAGTAAKWAKHGCVVSYVVITDGNIGTDDLEMTHEKLAATRRAEQQAAADIAGVTNMIFLGFPDGMLVPDLKLRKELTRRIREHKPNVVVCGDPTFVLSETRINHPDHRAAATAAIDAVFPSADSPLLFPDLIEAGYMPHKVNYVYITNWSEATIFVDITETIDTKINALRQHKCQLGDWDPEERMKGWAKEIGSKVGFQYAEAYKKITLREIEPEKEAEA